MSNNPSSLSPAVRMGLRIGLLAIILAVLAGPAGAHAASVDAGRQVFAQCAACHSVDGRNGVGPSLKGVLGRRAGTVPGFRYSRALKTSGKTWDADTLSAYVANPQAVVPGNHMPFSGLPDAAERADLLAYLSTLK